MVWIIIITIICLRLLKTSLQLYYLRFHSQLLPDGLKLKDLYEGK